VNFLRYNDAFGKSGNEVGDSSTFSDNARVQ